MQRKPAALREPVPDTFVLPSEVRDLHVILRGNSLESFQLTFILMGGEMAFCLKKK